MSSVSGKNVLIHIIVFISATTIVMGLVLPLALLFISLLSGSVTSLLYLLFLNALVSLLVIILLLSVLLIATTVLQRILRFGFRWLFVYSILGLLFLLFTDFFLLLTGVDNPRLLLISLLSAGVGTFLAFVLKYNLLNDTEQNNKAV